ncbi:hypothetical protein NK8_67200 (plasmid) [Caballeronia sp. NK8]|nr:hypothetical protein NK8_67200 [Caballeronia sp. NK8]
MKYLKGAVALLAIVLAMNGVAQVAAQPDQGTAQPEHNDAIVKMRMEIAAANKKYNQKVAAAKKVFDHKKAEAAKERDAAVAAAHKAATQ